MGIIKQLDKETVDKIAAGEVIVNAAAAIKELVENSIDAGADSIQIKTLHGGKQYFSVTDNGSGIMVDDIAVAFMRNATSKIDNKIDNKIDSIASLGFRGEALPSISCVSQITLTTKTDNDTTGICADIINGEIISYGSAAVNTGTRVEVRNIFYNLPVRYKYLLSDADETAKIIDITGKLALSHPGIAFRLECDKRDVFATDGTDNLKNTVYNILGSSVYAKMIDVDFSDEPLHVKGYVSSASYIAGKPQNRIAVINGRYVESKALTKAVDSVFAEVSGKTGAEYILYITLPFNMVDVNIHPAKMNVHFLNESLIMMLIKQGLKDALTKEFNIKKIEVKNSYAFAENPVSQGVFEEVHDYIGAVEATDSAEKQGSAPSAPNVPINSSAAEQKSIQADSAEHAADNESLFPKLEPLNADRIDRETILKISKMKYVGNAFGVYALFETDSFLYAVDTHAAHERVLYERYLQHYKAAGVTVQQLLVPVIIPLPPKEFALIRANSENLFSLGFEIDDFGDNNVAIRSIPDFADRDCIKEYFFSIIEDLRSITTREDFQQRSAFLIKKACHNAVRGKMYISELEARRLLADLSQTDMPYTCPHGRQIIGKISMRYFMKVFDRI